MRISADGAAYDAVMMMLAGSGQSTSPAIGQRFTDDRPTLLDPTDVEGGRFEVDLIPGSAFGEADQFVLAGVRKALGDGIVIAGEKRPVQIIYKDSQSNPNRAAEVTAQLINNDEVDLVVGSSTSDTVIPVSDQCELAGVPCVTSDDPGRFGSSAEKATLKRGSNGPIISSGD